MLSDPVMPPSMYAEEEATPMATITCDCETFWVEGEDVGDDLDEAVQAARDAVEG